jgi:ligand-binding sensor domain-containing protein
MSVTADNTGNIWSGASDGSINVYNPSNNNWRSISDIQTSTETSKSIHDLFQYNNFMFIATDFSVIKFNISQFQIVDQPYIYLGSLIPPKSPVYQTLVANDTIWAATKYGIAYANINNYLPIQTSWSNFTRLNSVLNDLGTNTINTLTFFNNHVYFGTDSGMVYYDGTILQLYTPYYNGNPIIHRVITHMTASGNSLYFAVDYGTSSIYKVDQSNPGTAQLVYYGNEVEALKFYNDAVLIGTLYRGVDIFKNNTHSYIFPNGPYSNLIYYIAADKNDNVWAVSGPLGDWLYSSGIYRYDESSWKNYLYADYPIMGNGCCGYLLIYPSPSTGIIWIAGWGNGLLEIDGNNIHRWGRSNSILRNYGDTSFVLVEGMKEDNNNNLWVLNSRTQNPIVNFTADTSYPAPVGNSSDTHFRFLAIDNYDTKWMTLHNTEGNQRGVMYFNEEVHSGNLLTYDELGADVSAVNGIIVDKNNEVWVATNNGVIIIQDPYQVIQNLNSIPTTYKMRIIENGISTPLIENVTAIRADALNNKWLGTFSNGVVYVSSDGSTLLNRLNKDNSPLPDNHINCIETDSHSGKVYFGTQYGLVSYQTVALEPLQDCDKIKAGPNPYVIPNDNLLRIDGLVEGSSIKILTISGSLVSEFDSPGGRIANWDGRDMRGSYVPSGIYIIVGYNKDGSKVCTGKVAVIRR